MSGAELIKEREGRRRKAKSVVLRPTARSDVEKLLELFDFKQTSS